MLTFHIGTGPHVAIPDQLHENNEHFELLRTVPAAASFKCELTQVVVQNIELFALHLDESILHDGTSWKKCDLRSAPPAADGTRPKPPAMVFP